MEEKSSSIETSTNLIESLSPPPPKRSRKNSNHSDDSRIYAPQKASKLFQVKISLRNYAQSIDKHYIFNELRKKIPFVECIVSTKSGLRTKYRSGIRFHLLINTERTVKQKYSSEEIILIIDSILREKVGPEQTMDEEDKDYKVNSSFFVDQVPEIIIIMPQIEEHIIHEVTDDIEPCFTEYYAAKDKLFSQTYRIEQWAKSNVNKEFDKKDPFLKTVPVSHAILRQYLADKKYEQSKKCLLLPCLLGPFNDWRDEVIEWWNDWVFNGYYRKKKQLFLYSRHPNTGKSTFVEQVLFRDADPENCLSPQTKMIPSNTGSERFAWEKADPARNLVIYIKEFDINKFRPNSLKLILEGGEFRPERKRAEARDELYSLKMPAILISKAKFPKIYKKKDMSPLKSIFKIIEIPDDAKQYQPGPNPYKEMFDQLRIKEEQLKEKPHRINSVAQDRLDDTYEQASHSCIPSRTNKLVRALSKNLDKNLKFD